MRDIIENVLHCDECCKYFYGMACFKDHKCFILHENSPILEFGWLVPIPGLLHIEMNIARAFTKLNWDIFVGKLGYELGFKSPKAQQYLHKGADHHKLWHLLEILYTGLGLELMVPYVKECILTKTPVSCKGYWDWSTNVKSSNYIYIQHAVLTQLHGLMMLRSGSFILFLVNVEFNHRTSPI